MRSINSQELGILVDELAGISGFYIDRFYEIDEGRFRLKVSKKGEQANLQIILSRAIGRTDYVETREKPTDFAVATRKRIEGFMIDSVTQLNGDRIVVIALHKGESHVNIILEMFGKGNFIITDEQKMITLAYDAHEYKDRSIKPGLEYMPPPKSTAPASKDRVLKPTIFRNKEGKAVDYSFFDDKKEGFVAEHPESFQKMLDIFCHDNPMEAKKEQTSHEKLIEEINASIAKQQKILDSLDAEIAKNKEMGDKLFKNIAVLNEMLKAARENKRVTKEELQQRTKIKVLNVDLKDKTVTVEVE